MENKCLKENFRLVALEEIVPNPKNPNAHTDQQIERLCKIIQAQGFRSPLVVSKRSGFLIAGHGRLMAAKLLDMKTVPVIYQDFENEALEYAHMTADNAISEWASLDRSQINIDMLELGPEFDIDLLGLREFTLEPPCVEIDDEFDPNDDEEINSEKTCPKCGYLLKA
jgi:hypothetical protein